ncbi:MAG: hypothetical protein AAB070_03830 [Candidatus Binatota bacterium]
MSHFLFNQPLYLLLLSLLPLLWLRLRALSFAAILWRSVIFLLLVLSLADLKQVGTAVRKGERLFAFDLSRSIPEEIRNWMTQQGLAPQPGDRTFVFGGEAREVKDWNRWVRGEVSTSPIKPEQTNLEALFSSLMGLPPAPRTLFLFTDGWETQGSAERLIPSLALSGMKVFPLLPADHPAVANVAVKKVLAPHQGTSGEGIPLKVLVENQNSKVVEGDLIVRRNGQPFKKEAVKIAPGAESLPIRRLSRRGRWSLFRRILSPVSPSPISFPRTTRQPPG